MPQLQRAKCPLNSQLKQPNKSSIVSRDWSSTVKEEKGVDIVDNSNTTWIHFRKVMSSPGMNFVTHVLNEADPQLLSWRWPILYLCYGIQMTLEIKPSQLLPAKPKWKRLCSKLNGAMVCSSGIIYQDWVLLHHWKWKRSHRRRSLLLKLDYAGISVVQDCAMPLRCDAFDVVELWLYRRYSVSVLLTMPLAASHGPYPLFVFDDPACAWPIANCLCQQFRQRAEFERESDLYLEIFLVYSKADESQVALNG